MQVEDDEVVGGRVASDRGSEGEVSGKAAGEEVTRC